MLIVHKSIQNYVKEPFLQRAKRPCCSLILRTYLRNKKLFQTSISTEKRPMKYAVDNKKIHFMILLKFMTIVKRYCVNLGVFSKIILLLKSNLVNSANSKNFYTKFSFLCILLICFL